IAGGLGIAWLGASGTWPSFWDVMLHWSAEYNAQPAPLSRRLVIFFTWLPPWSLTHLLALPLAVAGVRRGRGTPATAARRHRALLAAFYLGWVVQIVFLQKWYHYIQAPGVLLALAVAADAAAGSLRRSVLPAVVLTCLVLCAVGQHYL